MSQVFALLLVLAAESDLVVNSSTATMDRVVVKGKREKSSKLESSYPTTSLEVRTLDARATDTSDVLERVRGINTRSRGGVGARRDVSLDGLSGRRVRTFVDGVPSEIAGFDYAPTALPLSLLDRIDVYRGVVPVGFGTDALGGAIDFVSRTRQDAYAEASYRLGSFNSHQGTAAVGTPLGSDALTLGLEGFVDGSANSYDFTVRQGDLTGEEMEITAPQFNDGFLGYGGAANLSYRASPGTRISLRAFSTGFDDDLQNGVTLISTVAGEATSGEDTVGGLARAQFGDVAPWLLIEIWTAFSRRTIDFRDVSTRVYDALGTIVSSDSAPGELTRGAETMLRDLQLEARTNISADFGEDLFTFSLAPKWLRRSGQFVNDPRDSATLAEFVTGLDWRREWLNRRLESVVFGKLYLQSIQASNAIVGLEAEPVDELRLRPGAGATIEFELVDSLSLSLSYEWAIRLPDSDELLGDGRLVSANPELEPERSHNGNVILRVRPLPVTPWLDLDADVGGFVRSVSDQIFLEPEGLTASTRNVDGVFVHGASGNLHAQLFRRHLDFVASFSWERAVNQSREGDFARNRGDQLPNRPVLFGTFIVTGRAFDVFGGQDALEVYWRSRWVDDFPLFFERDGDEESKIIIPAQFANDLGITYDALSFASSPLRVAFNLEARNLANQDLFDFYRVPQPGRSFFFKASVFY
ncbi:MAG: TonB-dependent receptor plug domain-containing protein [Myxococcota bacterium]